MLCLAAAAGNISGMFAMELKKFVTSKLCRIDSK